MILARDSVVLSCASRQAASSAGRLSAAARAAICDCSTASASSSRRNSASASCSWYCWPWRCHWSRCAVRDCELALQAAARFDDELDLRFQAADFGIGLVQVALRLVQRSPTAKCAWRMCSSSSLDVAQLGGLLFQVGLGLLHLAEELVLLGLALRSCAAARAVSAFLPGRPAARGSGWPPRPAPRSFSRLAFSSRRMSSTRSRFSRVSLQAVFGFAAALLVLRYAGRFFQENAQLFRARLR